MTPLASLWVPILLSAVFVFIASSILHMLITAWHRNDFPKLSNEAQVMDALRPLAIPPGDYMVPRATSTEEMKSPAFTEKLNRGPVLMMTVMPSGPVRMGQSLALWFLYSVVVSLFAAYVASRALPPGSGYLAVHRFAGVTAFAGYSLALLQTSIWYRRRWSTTIKTMIDGLLYALITGGTFGWLWPSA